jgi:hypothetical protein
MSIEYETLPDREWYSMYADNWDFSRWKKIAESLDEVKEEA